jgi:hypothetical protein
VDLFLDVERRSVDNEVAPVLLILAVPDELWIEVGDTSVRGLTSGEHPLMLGDGIFFRFASSC